MKGLAQLVISFCGLMESEGRLLRENAYLLTRRCVILTLGLLFGAAALALGVCAAYAAMLLVLPKPAVLALTGMLCAIICVALTLSVKEKCEKDVKKTEEAVLWNAPDARVPTEQEKMATAGQSKAKQPD